MSYAATEMNTEMNTESRTPLRRLDNRCIGKDRTGRGRKRNGAKATWLHDLKDFARDQAYKWQGTLEIRPDGHGGLGVFTRCDIPLDALQLWFIGESVDECRGCPTHAVTVLDENSDERTVDARRMPRVVGAHMVNHSSHPNCEMSEYGCITNTRPLRAGEELTIDYSPEFFRDCDRGFTWASPEQVQSAEPASARRAAATKLFTPEKR